jgi:hypothetical protein
MQPPKLAANVMRCNGQRSSIDDRCPHRLECARYVQRHDEDRTFTADHLCRSRSYDRRIPITDGAA